MPRPNTLKHLPFFEVLASAPEGSVDARLATAGLLTLRMIDHWVLAGPAIVEPESVSVRSVRHAIMELAAKEPVREALLTVVNTMQMLRQVDLVPVLPRVFAYAQLLERHYGVMTLAADAYQSVIRLADAEFDAELVMDGYQRLAFCQRKVGALDAAVESSTMLTRIAGRRKDRARVLRGKIGLGQVSMLRGDHTDADSRFMEVSVEAEQHELNRELGMATHNRAVVASRAGNATDAVVLAHRALKYTADPVERDRVLSDLAAFLIKVEQYDAAIDALRILEVTASSDEPRATARVNLVVVAARTGNQELFNSARASIGAAATISVDSKVNLLIESSIALRQFGDGDAADAELRAAEETARAHGLSGSLGDIEATRRRVSYTTLKPARTMTADDPTYAIAADLRIMAAAVAA